MAINSQVPLALRVVLIFVVLLLIFTSTPYRALAVSLLQDNDPAQLVEKGDVLLLKSDFKAAEAAYTAALIADPKYAAAYAHRCYLRSFQLQSDNAIVDCHQAIALAPQDAEGYIYLTRAYDWNGDYKKAIEVGEKAIAQAPQNGLAHSFLGEAYVDMGQLQDGERELRLALELSPNIAEVHRNLAFFYQVTEQQEKRLEKMKEATKLAPDFDVYLWDLAQAYFFNADLSKATETYEKALAIEQEIEDRSRQSDTLFYLGRMYSSIQEYDTGRAYYQEVSTIRREIGDREGEGLVLHYIALTYDMQSNYPKALEYSLQELVVWQEIDIKPQEGNTLQYVGNLYQKRSQYVKALEYYEQALVVFRGLGYRSDEAETLNNIGLINENQANYDEALKFYQQALGIFREIHDSDNEKTTLNNIGVLYTSQGQNEKAVEYFQELLGTLKEDDLTGKMTVLNNIGDAYSVLSQYTKALEYFHQSLEIVQKIDAKDDEGTLLVNIGTIHYHRSQFAKALEYYKEALTIKRETGDQDGEAGILKGIGEIYLAQDRYTQALTHFQQSLIIWQKIGDRRGQAVAFANIGSLYSALGPEQDDKVLQYYQQALAIVQEIGNKDGEGAALRVIGSIYAEKGQTDDALKYYEQSLAIFRETGNQSGEGKTLHAIGSIYSRSQDDKALEYYQQALAIANEINEPENESGNLNSIGLIYQRKRQYSKALEYFQRSLVIAQEIGIPSLEGAALNNIANTFYLQNQYSKTLEYYQQTLAVLDTIRVTGNTEQFRANYINQYIFIYDRMVNILYKDGQQEKAFQFSEQGRARAFLDSMSTGYVELTDNESVKLYQKEQEAYAVRQSAREALARTKAQNPPHQALISDLETQLAQAEKDYQDTLDAISQRDAYLEQLIPGRSSVLGLPQAQTLLDNQTTLLSFWVLDDQTLVFVLTNKTFNTVALPISRADLYTKIKAFRGFANNNVAYPESAVELYQALIEPLKTHLSTPSLVIVPHGELHYLPFTALTDGNHYLIDNYSITYLPSVSAWPYIKQNTGRTNNTNPLIVGNPTTNQAGLQPLPFAESEAQAIASLYQRKSLLKEAATESAVRSQVEQSGVLHLAAHGTYNTANPLYSAIYLAPDGQNDGLLETHEIYGLNLKKTDLVVLSACETQLGELSTGDELVGLTRAFFFAGAPSVISSLWSVDDKATQLLMEKFYTYWRGGKSKSEALRQAQTDVRAEYPNPYYWAGFILSGDGGERTTITPFQNVEPATLLIAFGVFGCCLLFILIVAAVFLVSLRRRK